MLAINVIFAIPEFFSETPTDSLSEQANRKSKNNPKINLTIIVLK
jgi:hypothetical protein